MQDSTWQRWGGAARLLATASFVTESALLRHSPSTDQPTSDLTSYFSANRAAALAGTYLLGFGAALLLFFLAALRRRLARGGPLDGLASVGFAGGVAASAIVVVAAAMVAVLAFRPDTTPPVARALYDANGLLVAFAGFPLAVLLAASSVTALTGGVLPGGWAGSGWSPPPPSCWARPPSSSRAGSGPRATTWRSKPRPGRCCCGWSPPACSCCADAPRPGRQAHSQPSHVIDQLKGGRPKR